MVMRAWICRHRLRFKRPFQTAHGLRDGTDALYLKVERNGHCGYGEAAFPPYLSVGREEVIAELERIDPRSFTGMDWEGCVDRLSDLRPSPGCRALVSMALLDLFSKEAGKPLGRWAGIPERNGPGPFNMLTVASDQPDEITSRALEIPHDNILKIKLGSANDLACIQALLKVWTGPVFLDANQGWTSIEQAMNAVAMIPEDRLVGIEQPFVKEDLELHRALQERVPVPIYADESVQGLKDLEKASGSFGGLNVKAMKCGGIDQAIELAQDARRRGMKVMLGCMSESALACGAMLHLAPLADLVDVDGPWLLADMPFEGMVLGTGGWRMDHNVGIGAVPVGLLDWDPIGA